MAEKTEKPTDKKIRDSAKKGQSFKGKDMVAAAVLVAGAFAIKSVVNLFDLGAKFQKILLSPGSINIDFLLVELFAFFFQVITPVLLACFLPGAIISLLQSRFRLATKAIKIDFNNLNPISGFKKIFSLRSLKELIKAILYLFVFFASTLTFFIVWRQDIFLLYRTTINGMIAQWIELCVLFILVFLAVALVILIMDTLTEFFLFIKQLKMEKQEVKKEYKENEGDPQIKHVRRGLHQEILSEEIKSNIKNSTFVMANPTHIAIAIYFNTEIAPLPFILLKMHGVQAQECIRYAESQGVPVVRNIPLARQIWKRYRSESFIDESELDDVMQIIMWLIRVELQKMGVDWEESMEILANKNIESPQSVDAFDGFSPREDNCH